MALAQVKANMTFTLEKSLPDPTIMGFSEMCSIIDGIRWDGFQIGWDGMGWEEKSVGWDGMG